MNEMKLTMGDLTPKPTKLPENIRCPHCDGLLFERRKDSLLRCKTCGNHGYISMDEKYYKRLSRDKNRTPWEKFMSRIMILLILVGYFVPLVVLLTTR